MGSEKLIGIKLSFARVAATNVIIKGVVTLTAKGVASTYENNRS